MTMTRSHWYARVFVHGGNSSIKPDATLACFSRRVLMRVRREAARIDQGLNRQRLDMTCVDAPWKQKFASTFIACQGYRRNILQISSRSASASDARLKYCFASSNVCFVYQTCSVTWHYLISLFMIRKTY